MDDDIVTLNVGGTLMTTTRSTFHHVKYYNRCDTFWRKVDGHYFADYDPTHFAIVLNYLRRKSSSSSEVLIPSSKVAPEEIESFVNLVERLGLSHVMRLETKERFEFGFKLEEDNAVATTEFKRDAIFESECQAVGRDTYKDGVFSIKLKFEKMRIDDGEAQVGMIAEGLYDDKSDYISSPRKLFGWGFCFDQLKMYSNTMRGTHGEVVPESRRYYVPEGKIIELILDCQAAKLYMNTPEGEQYNVELPKWSKYKLAVYASCIGFQVRIVDRHKLK